MQACKIKQDAIVLLGLLGFAVEDNDALLGFCLRSVSEHICNMTNQREIPAGLRMAAVHKLAGEYLRLKHVSGGLSEAEMEDAVATAAAVAEIREGDVAIKFQADHTLEQKFAALLDALTTIDGAEYARWRKLVW